MEVEENYLPSANVTSSDTDIPVVTSEIGDTYFYMFRDYFLSQAGLDPNELAEYELTDEQILTLYNMSIMNDYNSRLQTICNYSERDFKPIRYNNLIYIGLWIYGLLAFYIGFKVLRSLLHEF